MTVRIGVVGTGFGARVVAPVFDSTPGCEVVDVVSARDDAGGRPALRSRRRRPAQRALAAVPARRARPARDRAGITPSCATSRSASARSRPSRSWARPTPPECLHLLNFEFRYDPMRELLRTLVLDGAVGEPEHVTWTHVSAGSVAPMRPHGWLFERGERRRMDRCVGLARGRHHPVDVRRGRRGSRDAPHGGDRASRRGRGAADVRRRGLVQRRGCAPTAA